MPSIANSLKFLVPVPSAFSSRQPPLVLVLLQLLPLIYSSGVRGCRRSMRKNFAIRSSETTTNPQRLYYKCDTYNNFRWCKGSVEHNLNNQHESPLCREEGDSSKKKKMKEELKHLKKKLKQ
ncbi:uncharacterized protein LOC125495123 [Beta vulgaris subsp. vulgaris]|uniref:uncharacterized protein LOC125495123 n=1 Tax=Beta vulgaris subsp. vulgaris TaxID=3555 RepID=UPI002036CF06|nr:uncharacterized protein LOC125495123 [Beta vulgaris subsp. vulgaris]